MISGCATHEEILPPRIGKESWDLCHHYESVNMWPCISPEDAKELGRLIKQCKER